MVATIRSENTKFLSYFWCLFGVVVTVLIPVTILLFSTVPLNQSQDELIVQTLHMLYMGQLGVIVFSASYWGQEYEHSTFRTTILGTPSRGKLFFTKIIYLTLISVLLGFITAGSCLLVLSVSLKIQWSVAFLGFLFSKVALTLISWVQIAWISSALTILTKSFVVTISILCAMILGLSQMLVSITSLGKYLPNLAPFNLFNYPQIDFYLPVNNGLLVQFIWLLLLSIPALLLVKNRDVK